MATHTKTEPWEALLRQGRADERLVHEHTTLSQSPFLVPIPDELNRYMLTVTNLPEGRYEILTDGRAVGTFTGQQLAAGLNIASATADGWEPGGPWDAEAGILIHLTDARSQVAEALRSLDQYLPNHPEGTTMHAQYRELNDRIEAVQRICCRWERSDTCLRSRAWRRS